MKVFMNDIEDVVRNARRHRLRRRVIAIFSVVTILSTGLILKMDASTLERIPMCGLAEHQHEAFCYADGELVCGLTEHIHTDACYQQTPVGNDEIEIDDVYFPDASVEELGEIELGGLAVADLELVEEEEVITANATEAPDDLVYDFHGADLVLLSTVFAQTGIECDPAAVEALGESIVEDDQPLSVRVEAVVGDYQILPLRDFSGSDMVPFAVFTANDSWLIQLKNGTKSLNNGPKSVDGEAPAESTVDTAETRERNRILIDCILSLGEPDSSIILQKYFYQYIIKYFKIF